METTPHPQQPLPVQPTPVVTQRQNSMASSVLIGVLLLLIPVAAVAGYFYGKQSVTPQIIEIASPAPQSSPIVITPPTNEGSEPEGVMCTMEAKVCPDGSAVGRTGPNCEFSPCPGETTKPTSDEAPSTSTSIQLEL